MDNQPIIRIIEHKTKDLGGFSVRRLLPIVQQNMIGPWIFFDHMGAADFPAVKASMFDHIRTSIWPQ